MVKFEILTNNHENSNGFILKVCEQIRNNRVVDVKPCSWECEETYPCGGHGGAILTFVSGETHEVKCSSVDIGALEIFFLPERKDKCYTGSNHFIEYITDEYAEELANLRKVHYAVAKLESLIASDDDILNSHYRYALKLIDKVIKEVNNRKVIDVKPVTTTCMERYPCGGHKGAILQFNNGDTITIDCDQGLEIGAIEAFYLPSRINHTNKGTRHFLEYITDDFEKILALLRNFVPD
jgi:hypothetical protein